MPARRKDLDIHKIKGLYESGLSGDKIAVILRCSENTILGRLREAGIRRRPSGPLRKFDDAAVCRMYKAKKPIAEIVAKTGVKNVATFYDILRRNGVSVHHAWNKIARPEIRAEIQRLRVEEELTHQAIADRVGVNRNYVGKVLREEVEVKRKKWQPAVTVTRNMTVPEMQEKGLRIDEIAEITGLERMKVFNILLKNGKFQGFQL